jgi:hypothetical protein
MLAVVLEVDSKPYINAFVLLAILGNFVKQVMNLSYN